MQAGDPVSSSSPSWQWTYHTKFQPKATNHHYTFLKFSCQVSSWIRRTPVQVMTCARLPTGLNSARQTTGVVGKCLFSDQCGHFGHVGECFVWLHDDDDVDEADDNDGFEAQQNLTLCCCRHLKWLIDLRCNLSWSERLRLWWWWTDWREQCVKTQTHVALLCFGCLIKCFYCLIKQKKNDCECVVMLSAHLEE